MADHTLAVIRPARPADAERLRVVERHAGARFREAGMADIAAAEPMAAEVLTAYARAGRSWVVVDAWDRAVGFVVVDVVDGSAHVGQISVDPEHQGRGLARMLLGQVESWAARGGMTAVTLSTFAQVSWNRPLYEHLGFTVLGDHELADGLRALRDAETQHGLDPSTRVCMLRTVTPLTRGQ